MSQIRLDECLRLGDDKCMQNFVVDISSKSVVFVNEKGEGVTVRWNQVLHACRVLWLALLLAMLQRQNLALKYNLFRWSVVDHLDRSGFLHLASGSVYVVLELRCMSRLM